MKKILVAFVFGLLSLTAFAEASFDEIQGLINSKQYAAAAAGLEGIIQNHPKSAKAFYAMAEAQAGLGNLEKAQKALNLAKGIDPTLKFVSEGSVRSLEQAITPQTSKITYEEPSHFWRNFVLFVLTCGFGYACYYFWGVYNRKKDEEEAEQKAKWDAEMKESEALRAKVKAQREAERAAEQSAEEALKAHKNYGHERFDPANPDKLKSVAQFKKEQAEAVRVLELREAQARAEAAEADARRARMNYSSTPSTTVVNNSGNDMLTGVLIGNMLSGSHHDTTRVVEREVVREVPSKSSSWDDTTSKPSRSSSWDDDNSSKSSSSWSSSSDSSSSSWDSGSSSSDSGSSSSWD